MKHELYQTDNHPSTRELAKEVLDRVYRIEVKD